MVRKSVVAAFFVALVLAAVARTGVHAQAQAPSQIPPEVLWYADTIYTNGKIITVDKDFNIRQALAVRDGKILAVGTNAAIQRYAGPKTEKFNLEGKTMIPGIIDNHIHLQDFAGVPSAKKFQEMIAAKEPKYRDYHSPVKVEGGSVQEILDNIKKAVDAKKPGQWVSIQIPQGLVPLFKDKIKRADLDRVAPNNPMVVEAGDGLVNTAVINEFKKFYGTASEAIQMYGDSDTNDGRAISDLIIDHPMESLYEPLKQALQEVRMFGVTTWSTSLTPLYMSNIYREMERRGELPIRFAYSHATGATANPNPAMFYRRLGDLAGMGSDWMWIAGSSVVVIDSSVQEGCNNLNPNKRCPIEKEGAERREALYNLVKSGQRIYGTHSSGDHAPDLQMDVIEQASKDAGMTIEQIRAKHHVVDHCKMFPRPDQIERAKNLGMIWNCSASGIENDAETLAAMGYPEQANKWSVPIGAILRGGGQVAGNGEGIRGDSYFTLPEMLVTRTNSKGHVWGKDNAVDRQTMLRMYTIWSADILLRGDRLGSIEPGKLADLVVLDGDFMAVPDNQLHTLKAMLTIIGGKVVYRRDNFQLATN